MNQHARILWAVAIAVTATTGCSRYSEPDKSPPYVVRLQAIDVAGFTHQPLTLPNDKDAWAPTEGANTAPVVLDGAGINFAQFRIDLSKPVDVSKFLGANPATANTTAGYCKTITATDPATGTPYFEFSATPGTGANADNPLFAPALGVCYDPSGLNPHFTVNVGYQTCAGVAPVITLEPLTSYTIKAHGIKDFAGQALPPFEITVNAADFIVNAAEVATGYHVDPDLLVGMGNQFQDITQQSPQAPVGFLDTNGMQTTSTADQVLGAYMQPYYSGTGVDKAFGAEIRLGFTSYMCYPGYEIFCEGSSPTWQDTTDATPADVAYQFLGDYGWPDSAGSMRQHVVSLIPLEDGRTYSFTTAAGDWYDFNYADWGNSNDVTGTFTTVGGNPRIVWQSFTTAAPAAGAGTVYPFLDPYFLHTWNSIPFLGIAANEALTAGSVTLKNLATNADVTTKTVDPLNVAAFAWSSDTRGRTVSFETDVLDPDTEYQVAWTGLTVAGGSIADGSFTFRTLPVDKDPTFPGFYGTGDAVREYSSGSGFVAGGMKPNASNASAVYKGHAQLYGVRVPADLQYDATATPVVGAGAGYAIYPAAGGADASVKLYKGAFTGTSADVQVAGTGGIALAGGAQAFGAGLYPGSFIGFVPGMPLQNNPVGGYTLVADVYTVGGTVAHHIVMPFSTKPASVLSFRGSILYPGVFGGPYDIYPSTYTIRTGTRDVVLSETGAANLFVRTSALVDPTQAGTYDPPSLNDPILMYRFDGTTAVQIPIVVTLGSSGFFSVHPLNAGDIKPHTIYQLMATTNMKALAYGPDGTLLGTDQTPVFAPYTAKFVTADQLLCGDPTTDTRYLNNGPCTGLSAGEYPHAAVDPNDPTWQTECATAPQ